jgi:hypothetical protein
LNLTPIVRWSTVVPAPRPITSWGEKPLVEEVSSGWSDSHADSHHCGLACTGADAVGIDEALVEPKRTQMDAYARLCIGRSKLTKPLLDYRTDGQGNLSFGAPLLAPLKRSEGILEWSSGILD